MALGDVDGDGDLDAFVANFNAPNRVWLNEDQDSDGDGVGDVADNCPDDANPGQENLDGDGFGDVCDDDVDGDGQNNDIDDDDDNDGLLDVDEAAANTDPFDPDTDDDGERDGLDRDPDLTDNLCASQGPDASLNLDVFDQATCAASNSVEVQSDVQVVAPSGDLLLIAPTVEFNPSVEVDANAKLSIISTDPTAPVLPGP